MASSKIFNLFVLQYLPEFRVNAISSNIKKLSDTASRAAFECVSGTAEVKMTSGFSITLDQGFWVEAEDEFLAMLFSPFTALCSGGSLPVISLIQEIQLCLIYF